MPESSTRPLQQHGILVSILLLSTALPGCTTYSINQSLHTENSGIRADGAVWVRGPWDKINSSSNVDEVIDQLCPAIMKQPRAQWREYGQEYCGLIYSLGKGIYYASMPSSLGRPQQPGKWQRKSCFAPHLLVDPRGRPSIIADYHGHPWPFSPMSPEDIQKDNQRWMIRIQFDTTCNIQKLVPYAFSTRPGELYERRGKSWKLIGYILPEDKAFGRLTPAEDIRH